MSDTTEVIKKIETSKLPTAVQEGLLKAFQKCVDLIGVTEAKKELGYAVQLISKNPTLQKCKIDSVIDSVVNGSRAKITLNPALRLAYLVPRDGMACLDISYMGLITILKKSGGCKYVEAFLVYQDEDFKYNPANGTLEHLPNFVMTEEEQKSRKIIGCYSRAILPSNDVVYCYMPIWEVMKVRKYSKGSSSQWSAWNTWEEEMIKKSVIKRHFKFLVSDSESNEVIEALRIEEENNPLEKQVNKTTLFDLDFE